MENCGGEDKILLIEFLNSLEMIVRYLKFNDMHNERSIAEDRGSVYRPVDRCVQGAHGKKEGTGSVADRHKQEWRQAKSVDRPEVQRNMVKSIDHPVNCPERRFGACTTSSRPSGRSLIGSASFLFEF